MKWFTVATEGQTTDGRVIERAWLKEIADTYNRNNYGARIWLEHIRGILPDSPFKAYGDVLAVRAQENKDGKLELHAQIDPTPELLAMTKARQKIYTSVEIQPNFAETGKCGLVGLAITDSPASLGTSILEFSAQNPAASPLAARKQHPNNLFSCALETPLDFSEAPLDICSEAGARFFSRMADFFRSAPQSPPQQPQQAPQQTQVAAPAAADMSAVTQAFADFKQAYEHGQAATAARLDGFAAELQTLRTVLDQTPGNFKQRPAATGTRTECVATDC